MLNPKNQMNRFRANTMLLTRRLTNGDNCIGPLLGGNNKIEQNF